jgi:transglutaminase-like putative cysteine protease
MIKVIFMRNSGISKNLIILILSLMLAVVIPVSGAGTVYADGNSSAAVQGTGTFSDKSSAANYLRSQMVARNENVVITYKFPQAVSYEYSKTIPVRKACGEALGKLGNDISEGILNGAMKYSGKPNEGDYLVNSMRSYKCGYSCQSIRPSSVDASTGKYSVTIDEINVTYSFEFYTTAVQEQRFSTKAATVISDLELASKSEYEKAQAIYSYIINNVTYDYKNLANEQYYLKQSAYAALINQTAVCQGYSSLFYYLALSAGLDSRIVVGKSVNAEGKVEAHAWNVVRIGSSYYYVDSTWDAGRKGYDYIYFLQGKTFSGHSDAAIEDMGVERTPEDVVSLAASSYYTGVSKTGIDKASVSGKGYYSGNRLYVNVDVDLNGKTLLKGFDYRVDFGAYNSSLGKCSIKIVGIGLYESSVNKDIDIVRSTGDISAICNNDTIVVGVTSSNGTTKSLVDSSGSKDQTKDGATSSADLKVGKTFKSGNYTYRISKTGASPAVTLVAAKAGIKSVVVPDTVKYMGKAFKVTCIGKNAFKGNKKLSRVTIGKNVITIEGNAFASCSGLTKISFKGTSVKKIGAKAFNGTGAKLKVTVPKKTFAKYKKMLLKGGLSKKATVTKK